MCGEGQNDDSFMTSVECLANALMNNNTLQIIRLRCMSLQYFIFFSKKNFEIDFFFFKIQRLVNKLNFLQMHLKRIII